MVAQIQKFGIKLHITVPSAFQARQFPHSPVVVRRLLDHGTAASTLADEKIFMPRTRAFRAALQKIWSIFSVVRKKVRRFGSEQQLCRKHWSLVPPTGRNSLAAIRQFLAAYSLGAIFSAEYCYRRCGLISGSFSC